MTTRPTQTALNRGGGSRMSPSSALESPNDVGVANDGAESSGEAAASASAAGDVAAAERQKHDSTEEGRASGSRRRHPQAAATATDGRDPREEDEESEDVEEIDLRRLVPRYLSGVIVHYHGDFYATRCFDPRLVAQLMAEGFLPIATRRYLLPKLHEERCVLRLRRGGSGGGGGKSDMHVPRSVRKKARRFELSLNRDFDGVVAGCRAQHGMNWLYPHVVEAFRFIHTGGGSGDGGGGYGDSGVDALLFDEGVTRAGMELRPPRPVGACPVRLFSVEVYNASTGDLVAGELGYTVGSIYTSLTGFSAEDSSGSVQLAALGVLLERCGFTIWDLGMSMDYKERLGARPMGRTAFVRNVRRVRVKNPDVRLTADRRVNCRDIIDQRGLECTSKEGRTLERQSNGDNMCIPKQAATGKERSGSPPKRRKKTTDNLQGCCCVE